MAAIAAFVEVTVHAAAEQAAVVTAILTATVVDVATITDIRVDTIEAAIMVVATTEAHVWASISASRTDYFF